MTKTAVVALGGNALTRVGQSGTYDEMLANAAAMASAVHAVIEAGWRVVIVHGNGPQVGNLALQQEGTAMVPAQPLPLLSAMTQGLLGSLLARAIDLLRGPGTAVAMITHVTVDPADPAFGAPSKPIGPFFEPAQARQLAQARGWVVQPDSGRGYRRVVASPEPVGVIEIDALRTLVDAGHLVIAAGGGGIPVHGTGLHMHERPRRRGHRQGPRGRADRPAARRAGAAAGHRGGPAHARLRPADAVRAGHDHGRRGRPSPRRRTVPAGQHGAQGRGGAPLPGRRRRGRAWP